MSDEANKPAGGDFVRAVRDLVRQGDLQVKEIKFPPINGIDVTTIPVGAITTQDGATETVDLRQMIEPYRSHPERKTGRSVVKTLQSLCDIAEHHTADSAVVFADIDRSGSRLQLIFDYHGSGSYAANNLAHRVDYRFPFSDEWKKWSKNDGVLLPLAELCDFLEGNIQDVVAPDGTLGEKSIADLFATKIATPVELITIARSVSLKAELSVTQVIKTTSGEIRANFSEEHKDNDGKPAVLPGLFLIAIPYVEGGEKIRFFVRFIYRRDGNRFVFGYNLYRAWETVRPILESTVERVAGDIGVPLIYGAPEGGFGF